MMMAVQICEMSIADYPAVTNLWQNSEGIGLSSADSLEKMELFFTRNPHSSFVAMQSDCLVGAVLSGHDGRRGFIYHLAVKKDNRRKGIGRMLVEKCLIHFTEVHIEKCHIMVLNQNEEGRAFWQKIGWEIRNDIFILSRTI